MDLPLAETHIYIDVSNIRGACLRSCGLNIDFAKLYQYFEKKYQNLAEIRYYEGISPDDEKKKRHFKFLEKKIGYKVCSLERKSYTSASICKTVRCDKCGNMITVETLPSTTKMKSNVDVYLASDMITCAAQTTKPLHIILVSCDGDYAEAIKSILDINKNVFVTILATPMTKKNNSLSSRLQIFRKHESSRTTLVNILTIRDYISQ